MVNCKIFIGLTLAEILLLALFLLAPPAVRPPRTEAHREVVSRLGLTDFAIWTEARYTRHPSQTDFFSPFQEFPSSLEHFPAGSVMAPVFPAGRSR